MKQTTLCYLERDGQYLMLHRVKKQHDENHDKWIGVGGKFEDKESPEDCVRREVLEETGLTLTCMIFPALYGRCRKDHARARTARLLHRNAHP